MKLRGKTAIITGASKGIGAGTAETLAEEGCNLQIVARSEIDLDILSKRLAAQFNVGVTIHAGDIRDPSFRSTLIEDIGEADILVNNAGDIPMGAIEDIDEKRWREAWRLKVFGYIDLTRLKYLRMKERRQGVIVNATASRVCP
jgi:short-subunit dehydrogenase